MPPLRHQAGTSRLSPTENRNAEQPSNGEERTMPGRSSASTARPTRKRTAAEAHLDNDQDSTPTDHNSAVEAPGAPSEAAVQRRYGDMDWTQELARTEKEMRSVLETSPLLLRMGYHQAMEEILHSNEPYEIRRVSQQPWSVWVPDQTKFLEEATAGGLVFRLLLLVKSHDLRSLASAVYVVEELVAAVPYSTFHQVAAGYAAVWDAITRKRIPSYASANKNILIIAMVGLSQVISARFNNLRAADGGEIQRALDDPNKDLSAILAESLVTFSDNKQIQDKFSDKCLVGTQRCMDRNGDEVSIFADRHNDYVLCLNFRTSSVQLADKRGITMTRDSDQVPQLCTIEGILPNSIVVLEDEAERWWRRNMSY